MDDKGPKSWSQDRVIRYESNHIKSLAVDFRLRNLVEWEFYKPKFLVWELLQILKNLPLQQACLNQKTGEFSPQGADFFPTFWRIIPVSNWLVSLVSKPP